MQWTNQNHQKKNKKSHPNLLCAVEGSSPGVDADALLPPTLWRARTRTERRASAGRFTGDTACGHYGRRRCSRLDGHVGVDVVTAVDHGGVDAARVSYAGMGCRVHATPVRRRVGDYGRRPTS